MSAVGADILTELLGDGSVALEQVLAGHAGLTCGAARRYDVLGIGEGLLDIRGIGYGGSFETAVEELLGHALEGRCEGIVKTNVRRELHHESRLRHIRPDHAGSADDGQFFGC